MQSEIITQISQLTSIALPDKLNREELQDRLAVFINHLISQDFSRLVALLYRIDVSETGLRELLKKYPETDAGVIIAKMIIERQEQKIESRKAFRQNSDTDSEERW